MAELKRIQIFKGCLIQSLTKTTHRYQLFIHLKRFDINRKQGLKNCSKI